MGRPRKPTSRHKLEGTHRNNEHGDRVDDLLCLGTPSKPQDVTDNAEASELWDLVIGGTHPSMQAAIDAPALEQLAMSWAAWRHYTRLLFEPNADLKEERAIQILQKDAFGQFDKIAARFGMTPCDRAKLQLQPPGEEKVDPLAIMLQNRSKN